MMKQEFDKIAKEKYDIGPCSQELYDTQIEPIYMEFGDEFQLTKEEMVMMYWDRKLGGLHMFNVLKYKLEEINLDKRALDAAERIYFNRVPLDITEAFATRERKLRAQAKELLEIWRKGRK